MAGRGADGHGDSRYARRDPGDAQRSGVACAAMEVGLLRHDYSIGYVAENGRNDVPAYFAATSLWAALDGSILLWLLLLGVVGVLLGRSADTDTCGEHRWAMVAVAVVALFFFSLAYFAADPFEPPAQVVANGPGPNRLLREHPAMGIHPPLLYAGYIGMVVPFAYCVGSLVTGRDDGPWLAAARRWSPGSWTLLTAGMVLDAWWSYSVLGWGGYCAVAVSHGINEAFSTGSHAALHVTLIRHRRPVSAGWAVNLYCATFMLVLLGTFLTRSGVVASVHSFTESPLGPMLLGFVLLAVAVTAVLLLWRGSRRPEPVDRARWPELPLLANAVLTSRRQGHGPVTAPIRSGELASAQSHDTAGISV